MLGLQQISDCPSQYSKGRLLFKRAAMRVQHRALLEGDKIGHVLAQCFSGDHRVDSSAPLTGRNDSMLPDALSDGSQSPDVGDGMLPDAQSNGTGNGTLPAGWHPTADAESKTEDSKTETVEAPGTVPEDKRIVASPTGEAAQSDSGALPAGWQRAMDPKRGQEYFYNSQGETTWKQPPQDIPAKVAEGEAPDS